MPRTASPARPSTARGRSRVDSFEIISAPPRHPVGRVLGLLIRLRVELFVLTLSLTVWIALTPDHVTGADGAPVAVPGTGLDLAARASVCVGALMLLALLPWTRRFLFHRAQAVVTRHRLRQTLVECRVVNFSRACPLFLWSRPTRVGEVVWLFLRAGISPNDVAEQVEEIAAGCYAREARVTPWPSMTALVRVEVIRRDPLAPATIRSEVFRWAGGTGDDDGPWTDVPSPRPERPAREWPVPAPAPAVGDGPAAGRAGDWSDYV
ncbi:hypothetical protein EV383_1455 [Pseudonocardia sediminis]|uniref:Uncharacterized protein n=1 Tax=Pseudonocardia sediminis TaxID=1397368 RepID=A0A4Q7UUL1_PSEST|nr:hypothetical protein [Pseudonocardia sediminis]RZT84608.1 hypothetical protein EV383_1455 [Pseudonocardia sediminis]